MAIRVPDLELKQSHRQKGSLLIISLLIVIQVAWIAVLMYLLLRLTG